jgi:Nitroreductase family
MDVEYLLTATPSARKSLDLDKPVDIADIRECLRIGLQAANGSNQQSWRWLVVTDPALRQKVARPYLESYLLRVGGQMLADPCSGMPAAGGPDPGRAHLSAGPSPPHRRGRGTRRLGRPGALEWVWSAPCAAHFFCPV